MELKEHRGGSLDYAVVYPDGYSPTRQYPLVVLLHGFGANMYDLAGLAPAIDLRGYLYAFPQAPVPLELAPGLEGYGWTPPDGFRSPDHIRRAQELLEQWFPNLLAQLPMPPAQVILGGFSQGGSLTYRWGLPRPDLFAGLAALSSSLPPPEQLKERLPAERAQEIFIAHGRQDPIVPLERGREAWALLEAEGYHPRYHEYDMGHEITPWVVRDLVRWMHTVAPPLP
ncbi:MAG: alpha/beta fold hydrolase [Chloroflexi bacterium]|nr:alpha/beta fold hydrolase [Chloroflexota bacterium]